MSVKGSNHFSLSHYPTTQSSLDVPGQQQLTTLDTSQEKDYDPSRRSQLAKKYTQLRAQQLPLNSSASRIGSRDGLRRGLARDNSFEKYNAQLKYIRKQRRPMSYMSAASLLKPRLNNSAAEQEPFNRTTRLNDTLLSSESTMGHDRGALLAQKIRQEERQKKLDELPLARQLEESLYKRNLVVPKKQQDFESVVSFNPSPERSDSQGVRRGIEGSSTFLVPERVQEEINKIDMKKSHSRTEALTPNFTDTEVYKRNQPVFEEKEEIGANTETRPLMIKESVKSAPWLVDSFETPRQMPRAAAPVPDRQPSIETKFADKMLDFGVKSGNSSWGMSPMTELPPSVDNSTILNHSPIRQMRHFTEDHKFDDGINSQPSTGLILLQPAQVGGSAELDNDKVYLRQREISPQAVSTKEEEEESQIKLESPFRKEYREIFTYRTNYAINLEPVTAQTPDIQSDAEEKQESYPLNRNQSSSPGLEHSASIVERGSPQHQKYQPVLPKQQSKTKLLLEGKIGSATKVMQPPPPPLEIHEEPRSQAPMPFKSPAHRYDAPKISERCTPLKDYSAISKTDKTGESSPQKTQIHTPLESQRSIGSPLRNFQKKVGILPKSESRSANRNIQMELEPQTEVRMKRVEESSPQALQERECSPMKRKALEQGANVDIFDQVQQNREAPPKNLETQESEEREEMKQQDEFEEKEVTGTKGKRSYSPLRERADSPLRRQKAKELAKEISNVEIKDRDLQKAESKKKADGMSPKERKQRIIEKIRREEALSKRKGTSASPIRVSGGMTRKPNFLIKKQKEDQLARQIESRPVVPAKPHSTFISRRASHATERPTIGLYNPKKTRSNSQQRSKTPATRKTIKTTPTSIQKTHNEKLSTLPEQPSTPSEMAPEPLAQAPDPLPLHTEESDTKKKVIRRKQSADKTYTTPSSKPLLGHQRRQNSELIGVKGSMSANEIKQFEFQRPSMFSNLYGKPMRIKQYIPHAQKAHTQMSFLLSPDSVSSFVKESPMTARAKDKPNSAGFKKREQSHEARKIAQVSPFVLAAPTRKKSSGSRTQSKDKPEGEKASKYCLNCVRLLSKGLSSAYCTMHSKYNAAPEEYLK